jgi:hypothetical protein
MVVSGQRHAPAALKPRERTPVPIVQGAGWASESVWTPRLEEKSFRLCRGTNLDRPVIQPIARHYTDWATPAPQNALLLTYNKTMTDLSNILSKFIIQKHRIIYPLLI